MQLNLLPVPVVAALFVIGGLGAAASAGAASARLFPRTAEPSVKSDAFEVFKLIGSILALFMIFVMTQCMTYYRAAEVATAKEAGDVLQLDHALAAVTPSHDSVARLRLQAYVRSLIEQEWPAMQRDVASGESERKLDLLQQAVSEVLSEYPATAELRAVQKNFDDLEDDRTARIGTAKGGVPDALWWTISALFMLLLGTIALLRLDIREFRTHGLYVVSLLLLAALLFMLDGPYRGTLSVSSLPLQHALSRFAALAPADGAPPGPSLPK